ncbi:hypothetical protein TNCV_4254791 [Trichonephila clavipes]|nr:hypothetical protein TNCV_4254791 [Trichonephila clavipes]
MLTPPWPGYHAPLGEGAPHSLRNAAVGLYFESRERHGCLQIYSTWVASEYTKYSSRHKSFRVAGGREGEVGGPLTTPQGALPQNLGGT